MKHLLWLDGYTQRRYWHVCIRRPFHFLGESHQTTTGPMVQDVAMGRSPHEKVMTSLSSADLIPG